MLTLCDYVQQVKYMLKDALIENCAPTLAGIKTGNLFSLKNERSGTIREICLLNGILRKKGLRIIPVKRNEKTTLFYLYRPERLKRDLGRSEAATILYEKGYCCDNPEHCLVQLVKHLKEDSEFPHEIGLFLGYPPSDVRAFMKSPCKGVKCVGCWKVYSNCEEAVKTFDSYRRCTDIYRKKAKSGVNLESLIVAENCCEANRDIAI